MDEGTQIDITWRSALMLAVCLPVLFTGIALMWHKVERTAALFLGLFLMAAVIKVMPQIIGFSGFYAVYPGLTFAPFSVELWFGPLLFYHIHHLMVGAPERRHLLLFVPGMLQTTYYTWAFIFLGDYLNKWQFNGVFHEPYIVPIETILAVLMFIYCWVKIIVLTRHYEKYLEHHESTAATFKPVWIHRLLIAMTLLLVLFVMVQFVPTFITNMSYVEEYPLVLAMMVILSWVGIDALRKLTEHFPKIKAHSALNIPHKQEPDSNQQQPYKNQLDINQITTAIQSHQWFLEPRFSLRELAERLGSNETYVSRAINQHLGKSFNQYINQLRLETAKIKLLEGDAAVLNVALDSGFNSKATFNRVFKDMVGVTPSQFKRQNTT
ncbi:AraC family transcriptional regulator [Marinicella sp. S1101]|uniref:helix-turn-helix domain-containing protein n=1 Tax=Marinicella marina TaxID=2996016 RepID=UPI002260D66E|nr:AraC family transcriptional regulator [Marinicella marina]MCX7553206.1 AraC family transcriptional regulator [Marinicella marina]MDJ1138938.1 AraC family transcriptional regulator [Marinicella marina]